MSSLTAIADCNVDRLRSTLVAFGDALVAVATAVLVKWHK